MNKYFKQHFKFVALVWLSSFVLAAVLYFVLISPQIQLKNQIASQFADRQKAYSIILNTNNKDARENLNEKVQHWRDDVSQYVISAEDLAGLTFDISQIAKDTKVESFSITSQDVYSGQKKNSGTLITEKQMKVDFKTDFNKFAAFLNAVERHRPAIVINEFSIANSEHDASLSQVNMILSVYVKKKQGS
jgi:hypothetical protein